MPIKQLLPTLLFSQPLPLMECLFWVFLMESDTMLLLVSGFSHSVYVSGAPRCEYFTAFHGWVTARCMCKRV